MVEGVLDASESDWTQQAREAVERKYGDGPYPYDKQAKAGSGATTSDQDLRSTAQAILALAGTPLYAVTATGATLNPGPNDVVVDWARGPRS